MSNFSRFRLVIGGMAVSLSLLSCLSATQAENVLTQHNDNYRTGANLKETTLNRTNVNVNTFGKLYTRDVDGQIYAQPLYVNGVKIAGKGKHNVVYIATVHNSVYAFDADDPKASEPLWHVNLGPACPASDFYQPPITDMNSEVGITCTPVIDPKSKLMYLVAKNKINGEYFQKLHALDITSGEEKLNGPVNITGSYPGTGIDAVNGTVTFSAKMQLQRPGLLLSKGIVTIAFGSHGDHDPYHGWIIRYNAKDLHQTYAFCTTPNGTEGAIWQAGQGLATDDDGFIYVSTGNGSNDVKDGGTGYGNCIMKLDFSRKEGPVADWFMPNNSDEMNQHDSDLGASGPVLIPGTHLIFGGSKQGMMYVVNTQNMGHFHANDNSQILQSFHGGNGHIHGSPIYFNDPTTGPFIYFWSENDNLRQYKIVGDRLDPKPFSLSVAMAPGGMPGGFLSVSGDGSKPGTGIVWASHPYDANANWNTVPGILRALDASDVSHELWNSKQNAARDDLGNFAKFNPPTIADGKVFMATFSNHFVAYGLLPAQPTTPVAPAPVAPAGG